MAASERLYELWLLYYAQVSPPSPASSVPPGPRAPRQLHLRPALAFSDARGRVSVRALLVCSSSANTCEPPARRCPWHLYLGTTLADTLLTRASRVGTTKPQSCRRRGAWTKRGHLPLL